MTELELMLPELNPAQIKWLETYIDTLIKESQNNEPPRNDNGNS